MNLLPVCHPPWAAHSSACPAPTLPYSTLPPPLLTACRRLSMHRNLRAAAATTARTAATPTANSNCCWATRDILYTDTQLLPLPPSYPSSTTPLLYLSIGSRHSQLPFRIELNSNFYQFTKATAGSRGAGQQAVSGCGRGVVGNWGVVGGAAQPRSINDGKESWQQSF